MARIETWRLERVGDAPPAGDLRRGVLYHSIKHHGVMHLCACGCGAEIWVSTYGPEDWKVEGNLDFPTMVGSFSHRIGCKSHYSIRNGRTVWH